MATKEESPQAEIRALKKEIRALKKDLVKSRDNQNEDDVYLRTFFESRGAMRGLLEVVSGDDIRHLRVNRDVADFIGFTPDAVQGKLGSELGEPPELIRLFIKNCKKSEETGEPARFEFHSSSDNRWFLSTVHYLGTPKRGLPLFSFVTLDITSSKNIEEKNRQLLEEIIREKKRLASLINSISDEIWFADTNKQFTLVNPSALREFGLISPGNLDIEKFAGGLDVYRPDGSPRPVEEAPPLQALLGKTVRNREELIRTPIAGEVRHRQVSASPVRDEDGTIIGSISVVRDITEWKNAVETLRRNEQQLRQANELLEAVTDGSQVVIGAQDCNYRYTYFNRAYADLIRDLTGKQIKIGTSMIDLFSDLPVVERDDSIKEWQRVFSGARINKVVAFDRPGKETRTYHVIHSPIRDEEGHIIGAGEVAYDVTEQVRNVEELHETTQFLENLITHASAPIIVWDPALRITRFNKAFEHLTGRSAREVTGKTPGFLIPREYRHAAIDLFYKAMVGDVWETVEIPIRHVSGDIRTVLWNSANLYGKDGTTLIATIAQGEDITDRKKAEKELQSAYDRISHIMESIHDSFIALDPQFRFTYVNSRALLYGNMKREEVIGKSIFEVYPHLVGTPLERFYRDAMESREPVSFINRSIVAEERIFELRAYPMQHGLSVFGHDITERKNAEDALIRKDETLNHTLSLLNASLESTADGLIVMDNGGAITNYNAQFMEMWRIPGISMDFSNESGLTEYMSMQVINAPGFLESTRELTGHPERQSYDMIELLDGRIIERYSKPQKIGHSVVGRVWSYRDVTDRRNAEKALLSSLHEKDVLLREIHHRVKNNLQLVTGLLDMTRMRTGDPSTYTILTDMMLKIQTMAQIHTRLYESRQFGSICIKDQIEDQIASLSTVYSVKEREICTKLECDEIFLPVDQAIPCALVINEVLSNAFKHAFVGRSSGLIRITVTKKEGDILIRVNDDGVGLPDGFDLTGSRTLGIKLIYTLVNHQLRGSVSMASRNGTGVTIRFRQVEPGGT